MILNARVVRPRSNTVLFLGHDEGIPWIARKQCGVEHHCSSSASAGRSRRSIFSVSSQNHEDIYRTLRHVETKLKLEDLIQFGRNADKNTVLLAAQWLQKDLPVRMGHRVQVRRPWMYSFEACALVFRVDFHVYAHEYKKSNICCCLSPFVRRW
jgi:hypothetical protein